MELHPAYDYRHQEWYVEVDGSEFSAKTLADLQSQLSDYRFIGYYPNGFVAERNYFMQETGRIRLITYHKAKERQLHAAKIDAKVARRKAAEHQVVAVPKPRPKPRPKPKKQKVIKPAVRRRVVVTNSTWTQEQDCKLQELCAQGLSASQIGQRINRTRNAVIGRVRRKGFQLQGGIGRPRLVLERVRY